MSRVYFTKLTDLEQLAEFETTKWEFIDRALSNDMEFLPYPLDEEPSSLTLDRLHHLLIPHWSTGGTATFGQTLLHYAAANNCCSVVKLLITEHGYITESLDVFGHSPLMTAVQSRSEQSVCRLVSCGAQANVRDAEGFTALHHASKGGTGCPTKIGVYCRMIQVLLDGGADVNARCMQDGSTALHMAAKAGHIKIVVILLRCGAIYDLEDVRGYTPLHLAVTKDANLTVTAILSACGASPHSLNHINGSPLHDAFKFCVNPEDMIWEMLCYNIETDFSIPDNDGNTLLHKSAPWKRLMGMCLRQDFDCDINKKNKAGNTPLHHIAITGQKYRVPTVGILPAMQVLLDDGAWMETRNNVGMTVLESASLLGLQDVIDLLDKEVETRQSRKLAVAMALHKRLGAGSLLGRVDEEVLNMVLEVGKIE
jgi:ankyrin repeat protein